jgi:hypothetical protein
MLAGIRIEEKRTCEKDVKNRGNELNNSFGINKNVKRTNSKRTGFACKKEQLEARKEQTSRERRSRNREPSVPTLYSNRCFKQLFDERLQGNWPIVSLVFRGNKARMSMKTKDRSRNQPLLTPPNPRRGITGLPSSDEEGLGVVGLCGLGVLRALA